MKALRRATWAETCRHCGGSLQPTAYADLYRCDYCDTEHLEDPGEARAYVPAERLGRRRVLARLSEQLRALGVDGHGLGRIERVWLPFWQVAGTLAGWQRYRTLPPEEGDANSPRPPVEDTRPVEEVVARRVTASLPACDLRGWGVLGIADVVERVALRPMRDRIFETETVFAVGISRRAADRRVLLGKQQILRPRGVKTVQQHFQLLRPERSLVYYPVWRVVFTVHGIPCDAVMDGIDGRLRRARLPAAGPSRDFRWWTATAGTAWVGSLHPVFGGLAGALWLVHRLGLHGLEGDRWSSWLSAELTGRRDRAHVLHGEREV